MKKTYVAFLLATSTFFACNSGTSEGTADETTDSARMVTDSGNSLNTMNSMDTMSSGPVSDMDKEFMKEAAAGGNTEVLASQIAVNRSSNSRVKEFANMMIMDHGKTNEELKMLASQKNVELPDSVTADQHKKLDDLRNTTAKNFDAAYIKMMDKDHKESLEKFEMAAKKCDDSNVKTFASKTLPALKMHKDSVDAIQKSM